VGRRHTGRIARDAEVLAQVEEVLRFAGLQGARTVVEDMEADEKGRQRLRVRAVRGEGKKDFLYEVLVQENGLMGIYRTVLCARPRCTLYPARAPFRFSLPPPTSMSTTPTARSPAAPRMPICWSDPTDEALWPRIHVS